MSFVVSGECLRESYPRGWQFGVRLVEVNSGTEVHKVLGHYRDIPMPQGRAFRYQFDLQMNLPPGNYYVEFHIWDVESPEDGPPGPGARAYVEVFENSRHDGPAQLNTRWTELVEAEVTQAEVTQGGVALPATV